MTIKLLRWSNRYRVVKNDHQYGIRSTPASTDIYHWKVIYYGSLSIAPHGNIDGTFIRTIHGMWFLPGMLIEDLLNYLFIDKATELSQFFINYNDYNVPDCFKCKGSGRLDWISRLTSVQDSVKYTRDPNAILQYSKKVGGVIDQTFPFLYISQSKLEKGEFHCWQCRGTGVLLDARYRLFSGLVKIKHRLKEVGVEDVINEVPKLVNNLGR